MQNRLNVRQKDHDGSRKTRCCERGKKYHFQKAGGNKYRFWDKNIDPCPINIKLKALATKHKHLLELIEMLPSFSASRKLFNTLNRNSMVSINEKKRYKLDLIFVAHAYATFFTIIEQQLISKFKLVRFSVQKIIEKIAHLKNITYNL